VTAPNFIVEHRFSVPGVLPFLKRLEGKIMQELDNLKAKVTALTESNAGLATAVEEANGKTDQLILMASATKDALVALQATAANGIVSAAEITPLIAQIDGVLAAQVATKASLATQGAETDAAGVAVAP
jgi:hypothetical protein